MIMNVECHDCTDSFIALAALQPHFSYESISVSYSIYNHVITFCKFLVYKVALYDL